MDLYIIQFVKLNRATLWGLVTYFGPMSIMFHPLIKPRLTQVPGLTLRPPRDLPRRSLLCRKFTSLGICRFWGLPRSEGLPSSPEVRVRPPATPKDRSAPRYRQRWQSHWCLGFKVPPGLHPDPVHGSVERACHHKRTRWDRWYSLAGFRCYL